MYKQYSRQLPLSVIVPTYNRIVILKHCLKALLEQSLSPFDYEVIVINDGSSDDTQAYLTALKRHHFNLNTYTFQTNRGRVHARNQGLELAQGDLIVFVDSDIVVTTGFLSAHLYTHNHSVQPIICQGPVILTHNSTQPTSEKWHLWTDYSRAFFATGNVSIKRRELFNVGVFDPVFSEYGWEDLELGIRLKEKGLTLKHNPLAVGFHWEKTITLEDLPQLIEKEKARARGAWLLYQKHPTFEVRLMAQLTPFHRILDKIVQRIPIEKLIGEKNQKLQNLSTALLRAMLNHHYMQELSRVINNHK